MSNNKYLLIYYLASDGSGTWSTKRMADYLFDEYVDFITGHYHVKSVLCIGSESECEEKLFDLRRQKAQNKVTAIQSSSIEGVYCVSELSLKIGV